MWYNEKTDSDIFVSTRIRIARNLKKYPFSQKITTEDEDNLIKDVSGAILEGNSSISKDFELFKIKELTPEKRASLLEEHLISRELTGKNGAVLLNSDRTMSIMINEEDHLRLQVIMRGLNLEKAYGIADKIDDLIEENLEYAYSEDLGYLTSCPTNLGTGLRASVMLHLSALSMTGEISKIIASVGKIGIAIRGIYGEGSEALGNLYQISNQTTLGATEEELIKKVETVAKQIEAYEKEAREELLKNYKTNLEDRVFRSYGLLKYAKKISSKEAKTLLSDVMLGNAMGIIKTSASPLELMIKTEPGYLSGSEKLDPDTRDIKRAKIINEVFLKE